MRKSRQLLLTPLGLLALLCLMPQATKADTITFNSLELPGVSITNVGLSYTELGFTFSATILRSAQQGNANFYAGSAGLFEDRNNPNAFIRLSQGGTGFSLNSIDLSRLTTILTGTATVTFTGTFVGGGTTVQTFSFSQFGFQTFTFNSTFTNLAFVDFGPQVEPFFQFDNVVVNESTAVPEPATMLLLGTGLAGVAAKVGRRRRTM